MNKKILIVNDIPGAGKVAGNINMPILSAARYETAILPTLILSMNTDYDRGDVVRYSIGTAYKAMLEHWESTGLYFPAYMTGYFGESEQIHQFREYFLKQKEEHPEIKLFVDPIMGDHGALYPGFNQEVPQYLGELVQYSDIVIPNTTEASLITGQPYVEFMDESQLLNLAKSLQNLGAKNVILSGIENPEIYGADKIGFFILGENGNYEAIMHDKIKGVFFGTGDIAMSLIIAFYLNGYSLKQAVIESSELIEIALLDTLALKRDRQLGVYFEPMLLELAKRITD